MRQGIWFPLVLLAPLLLAGQCNYLNVEPKEITVTAGGGPVSFTARTNLPDPVKWSLQGFGGISPATGASTTYTPPASLPSDSSATLVATTGGVSGSAKISIKIGSFTFQIDPSIHPPTDSIPDGRGGTRPVAAVQDSKGKQSNFVANEIIVLPRDQAELDAFLTRYKGQVIAEYNEAGERTVLVQLDPNGFSLDGFVADANRAQVPGNNKFSSEAGARLMALATHEQAAGLKVATNFLHQPHAVLLAVQEQGAANAFTWSEFNNPGNKPNVVQTWQFVAAHALNGGNRRVRVAIIDGGFGLNPGGTTPADTNGQADFPRTPLQFDFVDGDSDARGTNPSSCSGNTACPWHGTGSASVAVGTLNNGAFAAGTGGQVADPILLRVNLDTVQVKSAVDRAIGMGADVINMSFGGACNIWCTISKEIAGYYKAFTRAQNAGIFMVASAGNSGLNTVEEDVEPCNMVFCVGALNDNANTPQGYSNFGQTVDLWAPTNIRALYGTNPMNIPLGVTTFGGTSASAPYVAGIAAMMRSVNPNLTPAQVGEILIGTAWTDSSDPKVSRYVNALEAVKKAANYELPPDRFEPNNSPATATSLNPGQYDDLNLHRVSNSGADADYYRLNIGGYASVNVSTMFAGGLGRVRPSLAREGQCGWPLLTNTTNQPNQLTRTYQVPAGSYLLQAGAIGGGPVPYDLTLGISGTNLQRDRYEDNDAFERATGLGPRSWVEATIHTPSDADYYFFNSSGGIVLPALGGRAFTFQVVDADMPVTVELYDSSRNLIATYTSTADCSSLPVFNPPRGGFFVKVKANSPGTYRFSVGEKTYSGFLFDMRAFWRMFLDPTGPVTIYLHQLDERLFFIQQEGYSGIVLTGPGLHLSMLDQTGKVLAEGQPFDSNGETHERLSLTRTVVGEAYVLQFKQEAQGLDSGRLPVIPASLKVEGSASNLPPIIDEMHIKDTSGNELGDGQRVETMQPLGLWVVAHDPEGDPLSYTWSACKPGWTPLECAGLGALPTNPDGSSSFAPLERGFGTWNFYLNVYDGHTVSTRTRTITVAQVIK